MRTENDSNPLKTGQNALIVGQIIQMLQGIRYGSIEIVIHDNKVVQIERKEKIRPDALGR
jgi:hypothetical protein